MASASFLPHLLLALHGLVGSHSLPASPPPYSSAPAESPSPLSNHQAETISAVSANHSQEEINSKNLIQAEIRANHSTNYPAVLHHVQTSTTARRMPPSPSPSPSSSAPGNADEDVSASAAAAAAAFYGVPPPPKPPRRESAGATQALIGILLMFLAALIAYGYKLYKRRTSLQYQRFQPQTP